MRWLGGRARFDIYFRNNTLMALASVAGQLITSSMAAYAFAKLKFKLSKPLFMVFLCSMMIPLEATIVSNHLTLSAMGLMDTFFAVISTSIVSVFGVFLLRQFYMTIPDAPCWRPPVSMAPAVQSFVRIILPLGKSAMATIAIIGFIGSWNSYLWPLIITNSMELRTVQTGLRAMMTLDVGVEWQQLMAMSTLDYRAYDHPVCGAAEVLCAGNYKGGHQVGIFSAMRLRKIYYWEVFVS